DGEDVLRVVVLTVRLLAFLGGGEVGVEVGQVFAVEQVNGAFVFGVRGQVGARADAEHGERQDQTTGKQAVHHWGPFGEKQEAIRSRVTHPSFTAAWGDYKGCGKAKQLAPESARIRG